MVQVLCLKGICNTLMEADFCAIAGLNHLQVCFPSLLQLHQSAAAVFCCNRCDGDVLNIVI